MTQYKNIIINDSLGKPLWVDVFLPENRSNAPAIIFLPGFKAFKDWGIFPFMHSHFNAAGIALITVNFSHNGVTMDTPSDFSDLEAFAQNTISLEIEETKHVIDWLTLKADELGIDSANINLIGHSRGGAEAIVYASKDKRIQKVIAWAPVSDFAGLFKAQNIESWKKEGHIFIPNARTKQQMPINYSFFEDLQTHKAKLDVLECAALVTIPLLLIHGLSDESVPFMNSEKIYNQCLHAVLVPIPEASHTFNTSHPWHEESKIPYQMQQVLENTVEFILD